MQMKGRARMAPTGTVFNIQKFSVNDGPGIRTVVFLKGCPLRCRWCANPESQLMAPQVLWDARKCRHCGLCASLCPHGEITATDTAEHITIVRGTSAAALEAARACPGRALQIEGETKTVDEVVAECMQDLPFYEESNGGVTLSGGEPLVQHSFAIELARTLKSHGVHVAIETTGYIKPEVFEAALPYIDLYLFDIKHHDAARHREGTGVTNELPLANMKRAIAAGKDVLPRLPVIPGFNEALTDADGIAQRLIEVGAKRVQLLPFHQFGERKYEMLEVPYRMKDIPQLHPEDLTDYQQRFIDHGIDAVF